VKQGNRRQQLFASWALSAFILKQPARRDFGITFRQPCGDIAPEASAESTACTSDN
jgi:hypothetical protein